MTDQQPDDILETTHLWQSQPAETSPMTLEAVHQRALRFQSRQAWKLVALAVEVACIVAMTIFVIVRIDDGLLRVAYMLVTLGALFLLHYSYLHRIVDPKALTDASQACFDFYRTSLSRRIRLVETAWAWGLLPVLPGVILLFYRMNQVVAAAHAQADMMAGAHAIILGAEIVGGLAAVGVLAYWRLRAGQLRRELRALERRSDCIRSAL